MSYKRRSPIPIAEGGTDAITMANTYGAVYFDGTRLVTSTVGTATQVLTSNGAGVAPTFQAAGGSPIVTIQGDTGSVTGATVSIKAGGVSGAGESVAFAGSGTAMTFTVTDAHTNIFFGHLSGRAAVTGTNNVSLGIQNLTNLTTGSRNVIISPVSIGGGRKITTGSNNTGIGAFTFNNSTGASGITTGSWNTAINWGGMSLFTSESSNITLQSQGVNSASNVLNIGNGTGTGTGKLKSAFISGIQTIVVVGTPVLVSATDQLGVAASSAQFKSDIRDMASDSSSVLNLRPVTFVWNKESSPGLKDVTDDRQFGLIAEEVHEAMPTLVNYKDGSPFSVNYNNLPAMLLNEIQKLHSDIESLENQICEVY